MFHQKGPTFFELAEQALSSVERGYDLLAAKFDYTPFRTPDAIIDRTFSTLLAEREVNSAIDLCCGTGAALAHLRRYARDRVAGVDLSRPMLDRALAHARESPGDAQVVVMKGDVLAPEASWGRFDLACSFGAFGHILESDEPRFVRSVRALLNPGGRFVFVTADMPSISSKRYWVSRAFNAAMRVRNAVIDPPFVMYYLTFLRPRATALLEAEGFRVEVTAGLFEPPFDRYVRVVATRDRG
jgi:SAM-dependent methyltransferase